MDAREGMPCWVSLTTRDTASAERFYGRVLGWTVQDGTLGPEFRVATRGGEQVAGFNETDVAPGLPVRWTVFFAVAEADHAGRRVVERGGTVAVGPLELGSGRAAIAADRDGAAFGLWDGPCPSGWSVGEGNAPARLERRTDAPFDAAHFYDGVLRWSRSPGCEVHHEEDQARVRLVAGHATAAVLTGASPPPVPRPVLAPHWDVYFPVRDVDGTVRAAERAGGRTVGAPRPTPHGTTAALRDPDGALFHVLGPRT